jgi:Mn2+/Fe2+ NRAMP family transporter
MGGYVNSRRYNVIAWLTVGTMVALTIAMAIAQARG